MKILIKRRMSYEPNCIVCGVGNPAGVGAQFYETADNRILGVFTGKSMHRSYPHTLHGGVSAAILDDCIGRTIKLAHQETWGLTVDLHLTYKKPVPCDTQCYVLGALTDEGGSVYSCEGRIILPDGAAAVIAEGKYYKVTEDMLKDRGNDPDYVMMVEELPCPEYIEVPDEQH